MFTEDMMRRGMNGGISTVFSVVVVVQDQRRVWWADQLGQFSCRRHCSPHDWVYFPPRSRPWDMGGSFGQFRFLRDRALPSRSSPLPDPSFRL